MNKLLTVKEVAAILAVNPSTVYLWVEQGFIPCFKLNRTIRFDQEQISEWVGRNSRTPRSIYNNDAGREPKWKGGQK